MKIAAIVPAYNEAHSIKDVVNDLIAVVVHLNGVGKGSGDGDVEWNRGCYCGSVCRGFNHNGSPGV